MESIKIGVVILAGGDATRLGMDVPKGCVVLNGTTLFERILAKCPGPVAVMVSEKNKQATASFFQERGLDVEIFVQKSAPILGGEGESPAGNGDLFRAIQGTKFMEKELDRIVVCPVDNPLVQPDFEGLRGTEELVVLGIEKQEGELVGTLVLSEALHVTEYCYEPTEEGLGYTGIFSATPEFFQKAAAFDPYAPVHQVMKVQGGKSVIKQEKFVFDFFPLAKTFRVVEVDRQSHFYPIKKLEHIYEAEQIFI